MKEEATQPTLLMVVSELELQGYEVVIGNKYYGSKALEEAEENDELSLISQRNDVVVRISKGSRYTNISLAIS